MRIALLCFSCGVIIAHQVSRLPPAWLLPAILVCLLPILRWPRMRAPWALLAGTALAVHAAQGVLDARLPDQRAGEDRTVAGRIATIPAAGERSARFVFQPHGTEAADLPEKILVRWYGAPPQLEAGSSWRLRLRLRPPRYRLNPGGPDRERYLFLQRVGAVASVVPDTGNRQLEPGHGLHYLRQLLAARVRRYMADPDAAALGVALSVGDRQYIGPELRERLLTTGTAHLVAISGLHVGLVAGGVWWAMALAWRLCGYPAARLPAAVAAVAPALVAAVLYAALAGFALPTRRALLMVVLAFAALAGRRRTSPWTVLLVALASVLIIDPLAPLGAGLWLSFGAVAALLWVLRGRPPTGSPLWRFVWLQLVLLAAMAPLTLWWFGHIAWLAPLANAFAIPVVGSLAVPLLLAGLALTTVSADAGGFLLAWAGWLLQVLDGGLAVISRLAPDAAAMPVPPAPLLMLAAAGAAVLLLPRGLQGKLGGIVLLLLVMLWRPSAPPTGEAVAVLMDAGHGHALLVRTRNHALLFDTGPTSLSTELHAMLRQQGVTQLDRLVLSNSRAGSTGGADALRIPAMERVGVGQERGCESIPAWRWDGVGFRFLDNNDPAAGDCLLLVRIDGGGSLLVAHALSPAGRRFLERNGVGASVSWVIMPQHGNRNAASRRMIDALSPVVAFVPVDRDNRYGLPHEQALSVWEAAGVTVVQTGLAGAATLRLGAGRYVSERERGGYWRR